MPACTCSVALPIYNEAANLGALLTMLSREPEIETVIGVDDHSTDDSFEILRSAQGRDSKIVALQNPERSGQLAAWILAAKSARTDVIAFVDADAIPDRGAIASLVRTIESDPTVVAASGRVVPDRVSGRWPAARFRASILHRVRALGYPKEAIIGRFFAVRRTWFIDSIARPDIIANDAYVGALAARAKLAVRYVPEAVCRFAEANSVFDFAAQRQRADAGYAQLQQLGVLREEDGPRPQDYLRALIAEGLRDPIGALAWIALQVRSRSLRAYRPSGRDAGAWEVQATTKRSIE